jgi:hypothetical protein
MTSQIWMRPSVRRMRAESGQAVTFDSRPGRLGVCGVGCRALMAQMGSMGPGSVVGVVRGVRCCAAGRWCVCGIVELTDLNAVA